jgi:hypothetical protein
VVVVEICPFVSASATVAEVGEDIPCLKARTIHDTLLKLSQEDGPLMMGDYNTRNAQLTGWFAFRDELFCKRLPSATVSSCLRMGKPALQGCDWPACCSNVGTCWQAQFLLSGGMGLVE